MKTHTQKCASNKPKYYGDMRNRYPNDMQDCDCDGYHTFDELYDHRIILFITLCKELSINGTVEVWRSKNHHVGGTPMYEGWFILGIGKETGRQISYHLPLKYWDDTNFAETLENAPEWDGHTPDDVLERLKNI